MVPLTVLPREGLPAIGSVNDSMACLIPSETSRLTGLGDPFVVFLYLSEKHSSSDLPSLGLGHIPGVQYLAYSTNGAVHHSGHKPVVSDAHQCKEDNLL